MLISTRQERWTAYLQGLPFWARFLHGFTLRQLYPIRNRFSRIYLRNTGYEIGAQNAPLRCVPGTTVKYIDYLTREESALHYGLPVENCVKVDILCDANKLASLDSASTSFVIANHVLEHIPDPIGALLEWLRILRVGGVLFLTLPNRKANEFDFEKQVVPLSHLVQDYYNNGCEDITMIHIEEHVSMVDGIDPNDQRRFQARKNEIISSNLHTHYHVFDRQLIRGMLEYIQQRQGFRVVNWMELSYGFEFLYILRKLDGPVHQAHIFRRSCRDWLSYAGIMLVSMLRDLQSHWPAK